MSFPGFVKLTVFAKAKCENPWRKPEIRVLWSGIYGLILEKKKSYH